VAPDAPSRIIVPTATRMICIYCKRDLAGDDFNTEHVIPQAFGRFRDNLTLNQMVCAECNAYFGATIDFTLARGSAEALDRLRFGIKPLSGADDLLRDRVRFALKAEGGWEGLIMRLAAEPTGLVIEPVPQVGFARRPGEGYVYVSEDLKTRSMRFPPRLIPTGDPFSSRTRTLPNNGSSPPSQGALSDSSRGLVSQCRRRATT
jgi:hypothetical protein